MQNPIIEEITDNGSNAFTPSTRGRYLFVIGSNSADVAFDSGTVTIKQQGITLTDVDGNAATATAAKRIIVDGVIGGVALDFAVTGVVGAAANIDIDAYKLNAEDLQA